MKCVWWSFVVWEIVGVDVVVFKVILCEGGEVSGGLPGFGGGGHRGFVGVGWVG